MIPRLVCEECRGYCGHKSGCPNAPEVECYADCEGGSDCDCYRRRAEAAESARDDYIYERWRERNL